MTLAGVDRGEEELVDALRAYGIRFLSGGTPAEQPHAETGGKRPLLDPPNLLTRLAQSPDPRLRHALSALFLRHPELAGVARQVAAALPPPARRSFIRGYVAAVYLQQLWRTRWRRYLGDAGELPPYWIAELGLPSPAERFGKVGLAALAALPGVTQGRKRRTTGRGAPLGEYHKIAQLLMAQLLMERGSSVALSPLSEPT